LSLNESYPQHVVTAVIVAHDGAAWLPRVADALLEQTRPVQRVVAVDTGSRDRSGSVLAAKFGQTAVFGMDRGTGYGAAVARALQHRAANVPVPASSGVSSQDRVEWLWLLHDDCEPATDALEQLLRGEAETNSAAVLGLKLRDWANREVILEAGVTLDTAARRVTGIEPREVDQGQHDGDRDAVAVSSAGMLVRRDVWEQVGGFDTAMGLFMEDIDFCWRVHAAGYRVRVITDAVAFHMQAASRHRRPVSVGRRAPMLDRRNGLLTLLGNLPFRQMVTSAAGNMVVSLLRITFFLLAKRLVAALDEAAAVTAALGHPLRLMSMRRRRARGRRSAYSRIRADLPPGRSARRLMEFAASTVLKSAQTDTAGAHHASADPTDDDSLLVDNVGLIRRLLTSPAVLTFVILVAVALAAGRSLIGSGPLGGGALVPAWGGASDLWNSYLQAFHPSGIGSVTSAPPYLAAIAALATLLGGKPWLAIDVILLGCVPLAGMTAMLAVRRVTSLAIVRVWAALSYALLPVAMGVVAAGRFGTAAAFVLLPVIALLAGRIFTAPRQQARRAAWAAGLLVAIGAMFVPLLWLVAALACALAALAWRNTRRGLLGNLAIVGLTAPVLLLPWMLALISHPAQLLLEAGVQQPGTATAGVAARSLLLLSPGGPGLPPFWVTGGLLLAAFAALLAGRQRKLIMVGWGVAMSGLLLAIVVSRLTVRPSGGSPPVAVWAGLPLAMAAVGLLLAAAAGSDSLARMLAGRKGWRGLVGGRSAWAALIALTAISAPLLAAAWWLSTGVSGPVRPVTTQLVPELVAMADGQSRQVRTLVLHVTGGHAAYLLLRGPSPTLADVALSPPADAQRALGAAVAALIAPAGGSAVNQSQLLADFDIGYVLVQAPVDPQLAHVLDDVAGLRPYSTTSKYDLWQLDTPPARATVVEPSGTVVPISSGPVSVSGAAVPAAGGTLMLAEPAGGWSASLNGRSLATVRSPAGGWAQAFRLPAGGGTLDISHSGLGHDLAMALQALALLVIVGLALPGVRTAEPEGQHAGAGQDPDVRAGAGRGLAAHAAAADDAGEAADDNAGRVGRLAGRAAPGQSRRGAGRDRVGQGKTGQSRRKRGKTRRGKVSRDKTAALPSPRGRSAAASARSAGPPAAAAPVATGPRGARLADAWPYAAGDDLDEQRSGPPSGQWARRDDGDLAASERSGAWPYRDSAERSGTSHDRAGDDLGERRPGHRDDYPSGQWPRRGGEGRIALERSGASLDRAGDDLDEQRTGPPSGQWPRRGGEDSNAGERSGGWPYRDAGDELGADPRAALPGRSPSGRLPSGGWPDASGEELGAGLRAGMSARSPSGWVPPAGRPYHSDDDLAVDDRSARSGAPAGARPETGDRGLGAGRDDDQDRLPARVPQERPASPQRAGWRLGAGRGTRAAGSERMQSRSADAGRRQDRERPGRSSAADDIGRSSGPDLPDSSSTARWSAGRSAAARAGRPWGRHGGGHAGGWDGDQPDRPGSDRMDQRDGSDARDGGRLNRRGAGRPDPDRQDRWDSPDVGAGGHSDRPDSGRRPGSEPDSGEHDRWGSPDVRGGGRPDRWETGRRPGGGPDSGEHDRWGSSDVRGGGGSERWDAGQGSAGRRAGTGPDSGGHDRWDSSDVRGGGGSDRWDAGQGSAGRRAATGPDSGELDRWDSSDVRDGRSDAGRRAGTGPDSGELDRWGSPDVRGGGPDRRDSERRDRWASGRPDRRDGGREGGEGWAARVPDEPPGRSAGRTQAAGRRAAEPLTGWPGGGGDSLEPLPPLDGPGTAARGRSAWRPDAVGTEARWDDAGGSGGGWRSGQRPADSDRGRRFSLGRGRGDAEHATETVQDWDRYGSSGVHERRWPEPEPEPEYEGDSW